MSMLRGSASIPGVSFTDRATAGLFTTQRLVQNVSIADQRRRRLRLYGREPHYSSHRH